MSAFNIRSVERDDRNWVLEFLEQSRGSTRVISRGQIWLAHLLPGFAAFVGEQPVGLVTWQTEGTDCEIMTINSLREGMGIGTGLLGAVSAAAVAEGCTTLRMVLTNDNLHALHFCQKRGFRLAALYPGSLEQARKIKPDIPLFGQNGIPLRDELALQLVLQAGGKA